MSVHRDHCPECDRPLYESRFDTTFRYPDGSERLCLDLVGGLCQPCNQLYVEPDLIDMPAPAPGALRLRDRERHGPLRARCRLRGLTPVGAAARRRRRQGARCAGRSTQRGATRSTIQSDQLEPLGALADGRLALHRRVDGEESVERPRRSPPGPCGRLRGGSPTRQSSFDRLALRVERLRDLRRLRPGARRGRRRWPAPAGADGCGRRGPARVRSPPPAPAARPRAARAAG